MTRSEKRIVAGIRAQASAHRIPDDIADDVGGRFFTSEDSIEKAVLPQPFPVEPSEMKSGRSPKDRRAPQGVRRLDCARDKRVQMIGHKYVRENFNRIRVCRTQKVRSHWIDDVWIAEIRTALEGAHREEDTVSTSITFGREARWAAANHVRRRSRTRATLG
jgi:hypothetical protein